MTLKELIYSTPSLMEMLNNQDYAGIVSVVNLQNIKQTNNQLQTCWAYADRWGDIDMGALLTVLSGLAQNDIKISAALDAFKTRGLDLSNPKLQEQIDALIVALPNYATILTQLKVMGEWYVSLSYTHGFGEVTEVTIQNIAAEKLREDLEGFVNMKAESAIAGIRQGTLNSQQDILNFLGTN